MTKLYLYNIAHLMVEKLFDSVCLSLPSFVSNPQNHFLIVDLSVLYFMIQIVSEIVKMGLGVVLPYLDKTLNLCSFATPYT